MKRTNTLTRAVTTEEYDAFDHQFRSPYTGRMLNMQAILKAGHSGPASLSISWLYRNLRRIRLNAIKAMIG